MDRTWIDEIKSRVCLSSLIRDSGVELKRSGRNMVACCPFHDDRTPSFYVFDDHGYFYCHGCQATGDAFGYLQQLHKVGFREAAAMLSGGNFPVQPSARTKGADDEQSRDRAHRAWNAASSLNGTPAATYLESRFIPEEFASKQDNIRFDRSPYGSAAVHPALVAAFRDLDDEVVALQRVFLTEAGAKLEVRCKRMLGSYAEAAIKLNTHAVDMAGGSNIILCEGLEDGLTLARLYPEEPVWVAGGAGNFQSLRLPSWCKSVTIAPDNDPAGWRAGHVLLNRLKSESVAFDVLLTEVRFKDWNQWLCHYERVPLAYYAPLPWRDNSAHADDDGLGQAMEEKDLSIRDLVADFAAGESFPAQLQAWHGFHERFSHDHSF